MNSGHQPQENLEGPSCPIKSATDATVQLAHGGGGRSAAQLLEKLFFPAFDNELLRQRHDGARFDLSGPCAFSTDSYVVKPLIFPGGDIGSLAVNGTINDLAMCGAQAKYLSAGFVVEEGLPMQVLERIVQSMRTTALAAGVDIVTGDFKVVDRGKADGVFINTSGVGSIATSSVIAPASVMAGDAILLSGDIGRHGIAVLAAREQLGFNPPIESDCASLAGPALALVSSGVRVRCMRDLTRGGLASALVEIAEASGFEIHVDEAKIPVVASVAAACDLLGLDVLHVANEGRFIAMVHRDDVDRALANMRDYAVSAGATEIGSVLTHKRRRVTLTTTLGVDRALDMLSGEQLPRIC